jgi:hypothetical protein
MPRRKQYEIIATVADMTELAKHLGLIKPMKLDTISIPLQSKTLHKKRKKKA